MFHIFMEWYFVFTVFMYYDRLELYAYSSKLSIFTHIMCLAIIVTIKFQILKAILGCLLLLCTVYEQCHARVVLPIISNAFKYFMLTTKTTQISLCYFYVPPQRTLHI